MTGGAPAAGGPRAVRFRQSRVAVVFAVGLLAAVLPLSLVLPVLLPLLVVPLGLLVWALRSGTTVDRRAVRVRGLLRERVVPWDEVEALDAAPRGALATPVRLVLRSGERVGLTHVTRADLPRVRAVASPSSGGPTTA